MNNSDDDKNKTNIPTGDDEFVVPDHIQQALDEVHKPEDPGQFPQNGVTNEFAPKADDFSIPTVNNDLNNPVTTFTSDVSRSEVGEKNLTNGPQVPAATPQQENFEPPTTTPPLPPEDQNTPFTFPGEEQKAPDISQPTPTDEAPSPAADITTSAPVAPPVENIPEKKTEPVSEPSAPASTEQASTQTPKESAFDSLPKIEKPEYKLPNKKIIRPTKKLIAAFVIGIISVSALFAALQYKNGQAKNLTAVTAGNVTDIVGRVAKLVDLPVNETPSQIANVTDVQKLAANPFFAHAERGDVVLVYSKSQLAVLFRPSTNKIIAIGPIQNTPSKSVAGASTSTTVTPSPSPTVVPSITSVPTPIQSAPTSSPIQNSPTATPIPTTPTP